MKRLASRKFLLALAQGEVRACYAEARNGYRDSKVCEAME